MYSSKVLKLINSIWAIPLLIILRLFVQFIPFKIVCLRADRIGHFPIDSVEAICRAEKSNATRIYCLTSRPVNKQWYKMLQQRLTFFNLLFYVFFYEQRLFKKRTVCEYGTFLQSRDTVGNFSKSTSCQLEFSPEDKEFAAEWLNSRGITAQDKVICLLVRDNAYMKNHSLAKEQDFDYHNHRDSEIETYREGIQLLLDQGYWVIRMGRKTKHPLKIDHPKWIDYSQSPSIQSDLMDVWLFAHCTGCISTSSGPDIISAIYNRPLCFINFIPVSNCWSFVGSLHAPKKLTDGKSGRLLNWNEMLKHSYMEAQYYAENDIGITDLTAEEIMEAFREFDLFIQGNLSQPARLTACEAQLKDLLKTHQKSRHYHGWLHPNFKFTSVFLNEQIQLD